MFGLSELGYPLLFVILFIESLGIPMPSEISLLTAGYLASRGQLTLPLIILVAGLGSTLGALVSYAIAMRGGRHLIVRYGGRVGITDTRLAEAERFFQRYGWLAVAVGRVVSGVRALISYPAGLFQMKLLPFVLATLAGALVWPFLAAGAGFLLGPHWKEVLALTSRILWILVPVALLLIGFLIWRRRRRRRPGSSSPQ